MYSFYIKPLTLDVSTFYVGYLDGTMLTSYESIVE